MEIIRLKPGDLIQFGHNGPKEQTPGSGPFITYRARLREYIQEIRERRGIPVVVTPMERRRFVDGVPVQTLSDFAEAARQAAGQ